MIYCDGGNDKDSLPELENEDIGDDSDSTTVHVHDVDGDGDKDTVFGNSDQTATTYYKDGTGGLEEDPEGPTGDGWEPEPPATTSVGKLTPDPDGDGPEGPTTGMVTGGDVYEWKEADDPDGRRRRTTRRTTRARGRRCPTRRAALSVISSSTRPRASSLWTSTATAMTTSW